MLFISSNSVVLQLAAPFLFLFAGEAASLEGLTADRGPEARMAGNEGQGSRSYMSDQMDSVVLDQADDAGGRNMGKSVLHAADPLSSSLAQSALTGFAGEEDVRIGFSN